jgi:hypothetical protein
MPIDDPNSQNLLNQKEDSLLHNVHIRVHLKKLIILQVLHDCSEVFAKNNLLANPSCIYNKDI